MSIDDCGLGWYGTNNRCLTCDSNCEGCRTEETSCTSCNNNEILYQSNDSSDGVYSCISLC